MQGEPPDESIAKVLPDAFAEIARRKRILYKSIVTNDGAPFTSMYPGLGKQSRRSFQGSRNTPEKHEHLYKLDARGSGQLLPA